MKHYLTLQNGLIAVGGVALALVLITVFSGGCTTIGDKRAVMGNHGYRIFTNEIYKAFEHGGRPICVPDGWAPVGALEVTPEGALFDVGKTGILIKQDQFAARVLHPEGSSYEVTVLYPLTAEKEDVSRHLTLITRVFTSVARLYDDVPKPERTKHTVLITPGIAGDGSDVSTRLYPDPTGLVTIATRRPYEERAEGLLIHAVMHLYNRFNVSTGYAALQQPYSRDEFEELEATWAEVALSGWPDASYSRLMYLYKVHAAVVSQNPSLATEPPFNDRENFEKIVPTVFVKDSQNPLDYQYGHYVLLPLVTAATDALLYERGTGLTVSRILRDIHAGKRKNFMDELKLVLSEKDIREIERWLSGGAQVPFPLIETAINKVYGR